jgi:hypothetical protein
LRVSAHIVVSFSIWRWSGARLHVRIPKIEKHSYDPLQHHVIVTVVSSGRLPAVVRSVGVREERTDRRTRARASLTAQPSDGGLPLPRPLNPGEALTAAIPMADIIAKWYPEGTVQLKAWAEDGTGRVRSSWWDRRVKTPPGGAGT